MGHLFLSQQFCAHTCLPKPSVAFCCCLNQRVSAFQDPIVSSSSQLFYEHPGYVPVM
ncbi:hypothetical protein ZHAS_00017377 [Anopheles sinensis]|uniref:Uncharacterized protein n=1 Tax=Anopheles sinensis TaxID=74873 RepID=A0A084WGC1_ANOSI|nr:hypothetical protein ZHAS_00017377 [Anopheles sinensis]